MKKFVWYIWAGVSLGPIIYALVLKVGWDVASFGKYAVAGTFTTWLHSVVPSVSLSVETAAVLVEAMYLLSLGLYAFLWQAVLVYCVWALFAARMVKKGLVPQLKPSPAEVEEGFRRIKEEHEEGPILRVVPPEGLPKPPKIKGRDKRMKKRTLGRKRTELEEVIAKDNRERKKVNFFFPQSEEVVAKIAGLKADIAKLERELGITPQEKASAAS